MSESKRAIGSDLARVDAHVIQPHEYDDNPEWTDEVFDRADVHAAGVLVRKGRPPAANPKRQVTLRLDGDVVDRYRAAGPGWQTRMNAALRQALGL